MKIYLSPSLQEKNIGYGNYGSEEKRMNMLADVVEPLLKKYGHTVYRNKPTMTLQEVVAESNQKKVDLHLSLHSNASLNGKARGCEVFCYKFNSKGHEFASRIYDYLEPLTPTKDRGVKIGDKLFEVRKTTAPAVLVEIAFHDNKDDAEFIINNTDVIAKAIVNAINDIDGIEVEIDNYKKKYDRLLKEIQALYNKYGGV